MQTSTRNMAARTINAENSFRDCIMGRGFTAGEADTIARVYVHIGQLHFDAVDGQFYIRHGSLLDKDVLRNCVTNSAELLATRRSTWKRGRRG